MPKYKPIPIAESVRNDAIRYLETHIKRDGECLLWIGEITPSGYGRVWFGGDRFQAHRFAWVLANGQDVPDGLLVCHKCDVRSCVNSGHLFVGSHSDNRCDGISKGRVILPKPAFACSRGHPMTAENTSSARDCGRTRRRCKECRRRIAREWARRNRNQMNIYRREWRSRRSA